MHILDGSSPLGLRLRKSPSLLELIQMKLAMENTKKEDIKSRSLIASERVKASNFAADFLKIGTWEVRDFLLTVLVLIYMLSCRSSKYNLDALFPKILV